MKVTVYYKEGNIVEEIDFPQEIAGFKVIMTKYGTNGVKVWLYKGDKKGYLENAPA